MKSKISCIISCMLFYISPFIASSQVPISQLPWKYMATQMPYEWYRSDESVKVAGKILLYQSEIVGWHQ